MLPARSVKCHGSLSLREIGQDMPSRFDGLQANVTGCRSVERHQGCRVNPFRRLRPKFSTAARSGREQPAATGTAGDPPDIVQFSVTIAVPFTHPWPTADPQQARVGTRNASRGACRDRARVGAARISPTTPGPSLMVFVRRIWAPLPTELFSTSPFGSVEPTNTRTCKWISSRS